MDATANEPMGFLREYLYIAKMYMIYIFCQNSSFIVILHKLELIIQVFKKFFIIYDYKLYYLYF